MPCYCDAPSQLDLYPQDSNLEFYDSSLSFDFLLVFTKNRKWPLYAFTIYLNHICVWPIVKCLGVWKMLNICKIDTKKNTLIMPAIQISYQNILYQ